MPLLERDGPVEQLAGHARDARRGEGGLVLLGGEAGVGKSALVEQVQAAHADLRWSWGTCDGLSTPRPLAPLFDLANDLGGRLAELCEGQPERDDLFRALLQQVINSPHPNVLVIEDIHWADEATLDLLLFLAR